MNDAKNDPDVLDGQSCGARLTAPLPSRTQASQTSGGGIVCADVTSSRTRLAELETRLSALAQKVSEFRGVLAAIDGQPRQTTISSALDIGAYRVAFGHPYGAIVEKRTRLAAMTCARPLEEPGHQVASRANDFPIATISEAATAVWTVLENDAYAVQIGGPPGAGATSLLELLSTQAGEHGYSGGALWLTDVVGPAADIAERLVAQATQDVGLSGSVGPRSDGNGVDVPGRALVLLNRAELAAADLAKLHQLLPSCRFITVPKDVIANIPIIEPGKLMANEVLTVLADICGRSIDEDNARVAIDIAKTVGMLAEPVRLLGHAAREMQRTFISLRIAFDHGDAIVRGLVTDRPAAEARILAILACAGIPLTAPQIAYIAGGTAIHRSLARLAQSEMIWLSGDGLYHIPEYVAGQVPRPADSTAVLARVADIFSASLAIPSAPTLTNRQLFALEKFLRGAFERCQWQQVTNLGMMLAEAFAVRRMLGAWRRVLGFVESAANCAQDHVTRSIAHHQLGVRALVTGEFGSAAAYLRAAARERSVAGDVAGAAATTALLALVDDARALSDAQPDSESSPSQRSRRVPSSRTPSAQAASGDPSSLGREHDEAVIAEIRPRPASAGTDRPARRSNDSNSSAGDLAKNHSDFARPGAPLAESKKPAPFTAILYTLAVSALTLAAVALAAFFVRPRAHPELEIPQVTPERATINAGESTRLCVRASSAAVVEVFPNAVRLPGAGRQCFTVHPSVSTLYIAVATSADGRQAHDETTIHVREGRGAEPVITTFAAYPTRIKAGQSTRLCYAVTGANLLRMVPRTNKLTRLRSCATVRLPEPHAYIFRLFAMNEDGRSAVQQVRVDVVAANSAQHAITSRAVDEHRAKKPVAFTGRRPPPRPSRFVAASGKQRSADSASAVHTVAKSAGSAALRGAWEIQEANRWDGMMVWHGELVRSSGGILLNAYKQRVAGRSATPCERQTRLHAALLFGIGQQTVLYHEVNCAGATSVGEIRVASFSRDERSFRGAFWRKGTKLGDFDARKL